MHLARMTAPRQPGNSLTTRAGLPDLARLSGVDVVTALGRLRIVREYEGLAEQSGLHPGVVLSSSLAAVSLLEDPLPL